MPPHAPTAWGLVVGWHTDVAALCLAALLLAVYGLGVRRVRARGLDWPAGRTLAWAGGVATLLLVTVGGIGRYAHALLWVYTLQVVLLLLLTPVLLAFGRPLSLAADALPAAGAGRVLAAMTGGVVRTATSPLIGPLVVPIVLAAVFFTGLLPASLTSVWVYDGLHAALLVVGMAVALGLVGDGTESETSLALGAAVAVSLAEFLLDAVPGIVLRLRTHLVAPAYWGALHRPWGPPPLVDQQHAGAILWFVAEFADLPFIVILFRRWMRADAREAARVDRELDDAERPAGGPPELLRPWWETGER